MPRVELLGWSGFSIGPCLFLRGLHLMFWSLSSWLKMLPSLKRALSCHLLCLGCLAWTCLIFSLPLISSRLSGRREHQHRWIIIMLIDWYNEGPKKELVIVSQIFHFFHCFCKGRTLQLMVKGIVLCIITRSHYPWIYWFISDNLVYTDGEKYIVKPVLTTKLCYLSSHLLLLAFDLHYIPNYLLYFSRQLLSKMTGGCNGPLLSKLKM